MAEDIRWQQRFSNYCKALERLEDFLEPPALNEREQQGLIKAFEYTYELAWNTLRDLLRSQGDASLLGSRDTLREAFRLSADSKFSKESIAVVAAPSPVTL
jgi:nucleotidyltransferase substrate binding protein (TIGR01987 family)